MPNIRTFDTPALDLRPSEIGVEATAAAARRGGAFYNQAAQAMENLGQHVASTVKDAGDLAINYIEHREISNGAAKLAQIEDGYTGAWQTFAADPNRDWNDPTVVQQFRAGMEPGLQQFKDSFITERGRDWAEGRVDRFREHMFSKTAADASTMSAAAIVQNKEETVNSATSRVYKDPSALDDALAGLHDSINATVDSSPTLDVGTRARTKEGLFKQDEKLVKAAIAGIIKNGGDWHTIADNPKYSKYINATEIAQFERAEKYYNNIDKAEERAARVQRDYNNRQDFNTKINELEASTMPAEVGGRAVLPKDYWQRLRDLSAHPGAALEPGLLRSMQQKGEALTERMNKPEPLGRISHDTTMDLLKRMRATDESRLTDNGPIYDAFQAGRLDNNDFNFLTREFNNLRTPEGMALEKDRTQFLKRYAQVIDGAMTKTGEHSLLGTQQMYEFEMDARRQEAELRKQGKDPHLVYDPRSEYFWGRPENLAKYHVPLQEALDYEKTFRAMAAPPKGADRGLPVPLNKKDLIDGRIYDTARGRARWDAKKDVFVTP